MYIQKRKTVIKSPVTSRFVYCPLIWMFNSRSLNNKINSIRDSRALRSTHQDNRSTFQDLVKMKETLFQYIT